SEQTPRQRSLAVELAGGSAFETVEVALTPVFHPFTPRGLLAFQLLLGSQQGWLLGVLGDLVVLLLPAQDLDIVLVSQDVDVSLPVILRPAGATENLMRR